MQIAFCTGKYAQSKNSLYIFLEECLKRKWKTFLFFLEDIYEKNSKVYAQLFEINKVELDSDKKYVFCKEITKELDFLDVLYFKFDPPIMNDKVKLLSKYEDKILIINNPSAILKYLNKENQRKFSKFMPKTYYESDTIKLAKIISRLSNCVLKEYNSKGGKGVHHIYAKENEYYVDNFYQENLKISLPDFLKGLTKNGEKKITLTRFLKNVNMGDKRIIVVNGKIIGTLLRKGKTWINNISAGSMVEKSTTTKEEEIMADKISKVLLKDGIYIFGLDTLTGDNNERILSEVNTTNLGSFHKLIELYDHNPAKEVMDFIEGVKNNN